MRHSSDFGESRSRRLEISAESASGWHAEFSQKRGDHAFLFCCDQRSQQVQRLDLLLIQARANFLRSLQGLLSFDRQFVNW